MFWSDCYSMWIDASGFVLLIGVGWGGSKVLGSRDDGV